MTDQTEINDTPTNETTARLFVDYSLKIAYSCAVCNRRETPIEQHGQIGSIQERALIGRGWYKFQFSPVEICWACIAEVATAQGWTKPDETQSENVATSDDQGPVLEDSSVQGG